MNGTAGVVYENDLVPDPAAILDKAQYPKERPLALSVFVQSCTDLLKQAYMIPEGFADPCL